MRIILIALYITILLLTKIAKAETNQNSDIPQRPTILFNRWEEDWSVLANPEVPRGRLDYLKYIPLSANDPKTYLSLGGDLRERYESNNAMSFGVGPTVSQSYVISRAQVHADLRIANQFQLFIQLQNDNAPGKAIILPVDQNRLDLEQAFIIITEPIAAGTFKFRAGRQQFAFDLQRFISVRDGPNVRLSYDALWADYEKGKWKFITFFSHPVQTRNIRCFDDYESNAFTFGIVRVERTIANFGNFSSYFAHFKQNDVFFPSVFGNEHRNILDIRFVGNATAFDWDLEAMGQTGNIANKNIRAWAVGSVSGYTFENVTLKPRIGFQFDAASGNRNNNGNTLGTFNPLFPNGEYITLAGYTGYTNFIHVKPSLTLKPIESLDITFAVAGQWRQSTADAVYIQPDIAVPNTVGRPGQYTGTYFQTHFDWQITPNINTMLEVVYFNIASVLRKAGGHNSTYVGIETQFSL